MCLVQMRPTLEMNVFGAMDPNLAVFHSWAE